MTEAAAAPTQLTRAERLDRLPFSREHATLLIGSGIGWALDAMDVGLIAFVMTALKTQWKLSPDTLALLGSVGFIGMMIGASLGGWLADRIGRRAVFTWTLVIYGLATLAAAFSVNLPMLLALRLIVGIGLGAELPVASTLVSEFAPRHIRGRMVVGLEAFWAVGWILAALLGYFVVAPYHDGWRWALAIGAVPAVYALYVRARLPESVRYLEGRGRVEEAERSVRAFEDSARVAPVASPDRGAVEADGPAESIFSSRLVRRTLALWLIWFGVNLAYYGAFTWIPTLLNGRGLTITKSFEFTLIITLAQLPGYAAAAWLIEKWGRRMTLAVFLIGSALAAVGYGLAHSNPAIIAAGCLLSFFNLGAWGALYAIGPELYPTAVRGRGTGMAAAVGRVASMIAPFTVPWLIRLGGMPLTFGVFAASFVVAAVAAFLLPELKDRAIG